MAVGEQLFQKCHRKIESSLVRKYVCKGYLLFNFSGLISKWGIVGGLCRRYRKVQMGPLLLRPIKNKAYDMHGDPKLHEVE